jgi:hypothetical protein
MTQLESIIRHINYAGHITNRQALIDYSIQSLTRRIVDLEEKGFRFIKEEAQHPVTGQRYTRYRLDPNGPRTMEEARMLKGRYSNAGSA